MARRMAWELISDTFNEWMEGEVSRFAASLAFYTLFSLGPILIILLSILGALYGEDVAREEIVDRSGWLIGARGVQTISTVLDAARNSPGGGGFCFLAPFEYLRRIRRTHGSGDGVTWRPDRSRHGSSRPVPS